MACGPGSLLDLRFVERPVELVRFQDGGEVEEGPGRGRDGDALVRRHLVRRENGAVRKEVPPRLQRSWRGDLYTRARGRANAPERGGGPVTQHGAPARGEHRGHPPAVAAEHPMPDRIDAGAETGATDLLQCAVRPHARSHRPRAADAGSPPRAAAPQGSRSPASAPRVRDLPPMWWQMTNSSAIGRSWRGNLRGWRSVRYESARALPMIAAVVVAPATKPKNGPKSRVDGKPGM